MTLLSPPMERSELVEIMRLVVLSVCVSVSVSVCLCILRLAEICTLTSVF